jgi:hypothetical protein
MKLALFLLIALFTSACGLLTRDHAEPYRHALQLPGQEVDVSLCRIELPDYDEPLHYWDLLYSDFSDLRAICIDTETKCGKEPNANLFLDAKRSGIKFNDSDQGQLNVYIEHEYRKLPVQANLDDGRVLLSNSGSCTSGKTHYRENKIYLLAQSQIDKSKNKALPGVRPFPTGEIEVGLMFMDGERPLNKTYRFSITSETHLESWAYGAYVFGQPQTPQQNFKRNAEIMEKCIARKNVATDENARNLGENAEEECADEYGFYKDSSGKWHR